MKKRGFTLIELLAVIVILAIIGLIAVPIVSDIVIDAKRKAAEEHVNRISKQASNYYRQQELNDRIITSVDFSKAKKLKSIGYSAFEENQLNSLKFIDNETNSSSLKIIEDYAFVFNQLSSVTIPASVQIIGEWAFYENQLASVNFIDTDTSPSDLTIIKEGAFGENSLNNGIIIPSRVQTIEDYAFDGNQLTNLIIPSSVTKIGGNPFAFNSTLTTIEVEGNNLNYKSVNNAIYTKDGKKLITGTKGMSNNIELTVEIIGDGAFGGMDLSELIIPASVQTIGQASFTWNQLTSLEIIDTEEMPSNLITIGYQAFCCNQLNSVTIPFSVEVIEGGAFEYNNIENLTLPNKYIDIGCYAFFGNPLTTVVNPYGLNLEGSCGW